MCLLIGDFGEARKPRRAGYIAQRHPHYDPSMLKHASLAKYLLQTIAWWQVKRSEVNAPCRQKTS